jgi:D-serine deaminase-like pyridoxal phosphate-dependent protein
MNNPFFDQITKPTLILNEQIARENIRRMADKARQAKVQFRPHFKTHQSTAIGEWFRDEGVQRITVSSVDMAEYFAAGGWKDITIAFTLNTRQISQIQSLASQITLGVLIEDSESVSLLGCSIKGNLNIWIKIDSGTHRTGLAWTNHAKLFEILTKSFDYPNLNVLGILTHAGSTYHAQSTMDAIRLHTESTSRLIELRESIIQAGFPTPLISIGDTPGVSLVSKLGNIDEIRPGNFVFFDAEQLEIGSCTPQQIAVALACPIVAQHPERNEVVIYGGAIHLSKESFLHSGQSSYGLVTAPESNGWGEILPECSVVRLSQEHGIISIPEKMFNHFPIGGLATIIPAHSCLTVHLMRRYLTLEGKPIEIMPV